MISTTLVLTGSILTTNMIWCYWESICPIWELHVYILVTSDLTSLSSPTLTIAHFARYPSAVLTTYSLGYVASLKTKCCLTLWLNSALSNFSISSVDITCDIDLTRSCLESSPALLNLSASESCTADREVLGRVSWCNPIDTTCASDYSSSDG